MKILVAATHVPFVHGGAEAHMEALRRALVACGHEVELLRIPFSFWPESQVVETMRFCEKFDLNRLAVTPEKVISLQFPVYGLDHPDHTVWLMHQHRAVYELYGEVVPKTETLTELRRQVMEFDGRTLRRARRLLANSRRVAERLRHFNGLTAEPLYHPPPDADRFYSAEPWDYVLFPSRLEQLKRQHLLIEAARYVRVPVRFILLGEGGQREQLETMIHRYGLEDRVHLLGYRPRHEQLVWYAHALAVFFGPHDEDYGYVTLEAMLAGKPVITCTDSGGPLEFVQAEATGLVVPPEPQAIAAAIERLHGDRKLAARLGQAGREAVTALDLRWETVVERLLA